MSRVHPSGLGAGTMVVVLSVTSTLYAVVPFRIDPITPVTPTGRSEAAGISPSGNFVSGFAFFGPAEPSSSRGMRYASTTATTTVLGPTPAPSLAFQQARGVNDSGTMVGFGSNSAPFFSYSENATPLLWSGSSVSRLPLPAGETVGRATSINNAGLIVGSVGSALNNGGGQRAAVFSPSGSSVLSQTTITGGSLFSANAVNGEGRIVGSARDPLQPFLALLPFYLDPGDTVARLIPLPPGETTASADAVSSNGFVAGASTPSLFSTQPFAQPFLWKPNVGTIRIPMEDVFATNGYATGVNRHGWVVGNSSTSSSFGPSPFVYDGTRAYVLAGLIQNLSDGWIFPGGQYEISGIADDFSITGTALFNGVRTAYRLTPIPEPTSLVVLVLPAALLGVRRRSRSGVAGMVG